VRKKWPWRSRNISNATAILSTNDPVSHHPRIPLPDEPQASIRPPSHESIVRQGNQHGRSASRAKARVVAANRTIGDFGPGTGNVILSNYATAVQRRVQALARAHGLLADHGWREIPLDQLVRAQVSLFGDSGGSPSTARRWIYRPQSFSHWHFVGQSAWSDESVLARCASSSCRRWRRRAGSRLGLSTTRAS
jgi:hypothetical protein